MNEIWLELVRLIPALLWFALAVCLLVVFRARLADLFTRLGTVEAMGIKLVCMRECIEAALDLAEKAPQWQIHVPPEDKRRALDRARAQYRLIKGAQFLWVDDKPENNVNERRMFRQLDVDIDTATDNEKALAALATAAYDLVISDIARPGQTSSGLDLTKDLQAHGLNVPVVFYVGDYRPELGGPPHAFDPEGHLQSLGGYGQGGGVPVQGHASVRDLRVIGAGEIEPFCERPSRPQATCRRVFTPPLVERDV